MGTATQDPTAATNVSLTRNTGAMRKGPLSPLLAPAGPSSDPSDAGAQLLLPLRSWPPPPPTSLTHAHGGALCQSHPRHKIPLWMLWLPHCPCLPLSHMYPLVQENHSEESLGSLALVSPSIPALAHPDWESLSSLFLTWVSGPRAPLSHGSCGQALAPPWGSMGPGGRHPRPRAVLLFLSPRGLSWLRVFLGPSGGVRGPVPSHSLFSSSSSRSVALCGLWQCVLAASSQDIW